MPTSLDASAREVDTAGADSDSAEPDIVHMLAVAVDDTPVGVTRLEQVDGAQRL